MPRNMSFFHTQEQMRNRTKTVTRRLGWDFLKPGDIVNACVKCQGLKKGEKIEVICQIRIRSNEPVRLGKISQREVVKEGFVHYSPRDFVRMFFNHMHVDPYEVVNRIEFEFIDEVPK